MSDPPAPTPKPLLYIIHAAADKALALLLRSQIEASVPDLKVFLASKPGDIPTGEEWLRHVQAKLIAATAFLLLLTPRSVQRYWVWYEAGVAWHKGPDVRKLPVVAGGLDKGAVHYPLGASQILELDHPDQAEQLFRDLGGELESAADFCRAVRAAALPAPSSAEELQHVRDALGTVGLPPRAVLRRMVAGERLTFDDMQSELAHSNFAQDGHSTQLVFDTLKATGLLEADDDQRWTVRADFRDTVRTYLNPSLAQKLRALADEMHRWAETQASGFDGNEWNQRFVPPLMALREKARRDHGEDDTWLDKIPAHYTAVNQIADALIRIADRLPE